MRNAVENHGPCVGPETRLSMCLFHGSAVKSSGEHKA